MPKQTEKKPAAAKYEWRKTEKAFYLPKEKGPVRIDVPEMKFSRTSDGEALFWKVKAYPEDEFSEGDAIP